MTTDSGDAAPIRTPDQRLRVFVSSTLAELAPERAAVARAISALRLTPVMFELGARPHPPRELYRAYLAQSDVFVGLYWQRYGWIGPGMDISGLEDEFRLSDGMPRLLYMKSPAPEQEPRLAAMIADLQSAGADSYRSFSTTRELGRLVRDDLALLLSERFATAGSAAAAAPSAAPAATETRSPRRSLPTPSTSLIGREDDIAELSALLESPDVRLVTLTGPGGIGKTRLAIAVGAALAEAGRRTEFISLASITDPALVLPRVAAAVGAPIEGTRSALDTLIEHFARDPDAAGPRQPRAGDRRGNRARSAPRRVLRRHDPRHEPHRCCASAPSGSTRSSRCRCRHSPRRPPLDELAALPAVRLFVDRARAVRHDFTLDDTNAAAVDGDLPPPRRASARDRARRGSHPAARTDRAARPTRTRSRRAGHGTSSTCPSASAPCGRPSSGASDSSTTRSASSWRRLSVFADGWTLDAAARVGGRTEDETLDLLDALAGHSLVSVVAERRRTPLPHARDGARARRRAARCRRRRCATLRSDTPSTSPSSWRTQLARRTTGRMGRPAGRGGGEPASRDPLVLHPRHHAAASHVPRAVAVLADARPDDRRVGVDGRASPASRRSRRSLPRPRCCSRRR